MRGLIIGHILGEKTCLMALSSNRKILVIGPESVLPATVPVNQYEIMITRPPRNMIMVITVVVSPTEKVAAWQGMQMMLFEGRIMDAAPTAFPLKWQLRQEALSSPETIWWILVVLPDWPSLSHRTNPLSRSRTGRIPFR